MQTSARSEKQESSVAKQYQNIQELLNSGTMNDGQAAFAGMMSQQIHHQNGGLKRDLDEAGFDHDDDSDSESNKSINEMIVNSTQNSTGLKPGKKTKGRVKIKMEFIENKLRRYTTFSKRKTGIMKKAYELSTLTGTQVMLLVASETGHVYTFATRKLQPMITSESGKALIQTCLNSPDPPPGATQNTLDQRMNPGGFEETELSYAVSEEEEAKQQQMAEAAQKYVLASTENNVKTVSSSSTPGHVQPLSMTTYLPPASSTSNNMASMTTTSTNGTHQSSKTNSFSMQLPTGGITTLLPQNSLPPGTPIATINALQATQQQLTGQQQTVYRFPTNQQGVLSIPGVQTNSPQQLNNSMNQETLQQQTNTSVASNTSSSSANVSPGTVMYQTPQGVVYATPSATTLNALTEGYITVNFPQGPASIPLVQDQQNPQGQPFIIPVSLANALNTQMLFTQSAGGDTGQALMVQTSKGK